MLKSKLLDLFSTLDKSELKEFGKYIEGTSYRKTGKVYALYAYLAKQYPEYPEKKIEKTVVAKKVLTDQKNAQKQMLDLMTRLTGVLEDYLIKKQLANNKTKRNFLLLDVMKERKLDKMFFQKINSIEKDWKKNRPAGIEQLYNEFKLAQTCLLHPNYDNLPDMPIRPSHLIEKFDKYYFARKSYLGTIFLTHLVFTSETVDDAFFLDEMFDLIADHNLNNDPHISIFSKLLIAQKQNIYSNYEGIYNEFKTNLPLFNSYERTDIMKILVSYCYANYKKGQADGLKQMFELYKFCSEEKIIIEDGYIENVQFRHIVIIACAVNKAEWALKFIKDNQIYLEENKKDDNLALCNSWVLFKLKDFDGVLEILARIKFQDITIGIQGRGLQLKCYYELEEYEELFFNLCKSFSAFLNRDKELTDSVKEPWINFIRISKKLQLSKNKFESNVPIILDEINSQQIVANKLWLIEKCNILLKKK